MSDYRFGTIQSAWLGIDHGVMSFRLDIEGNGWGCGYGGYVIDNYMIDTENRACSVHIENPGTLETIRRLLFKFNVGTVQELEGKLCFVRMKSAEYSEVIDAISPVGYRFCDDDGNVIYNWFSWQEEIKKTRDKVIAAWRRILDDAD